jgi:hypothetical protein
MLLLLLGIFVVVFTRSFYNTNTRIVILLFFQTCLQAPAHSATFTARPRCVKLSIKLYETLRNFAKLYETLRNFTKLYETLRIFTKLYETSRIVSARPRCVLRSTKLCWNFMKFYGTVEVCETFHKTLRNAKKHYETLRHCRGVRTCRRK